MDIAGFYEELIDKYGSQGWWPLLEVQGINPTKTGAVKGYHPGDYSYPKNERQRFEICVGAILTQNTAWPNVEKALFNLDKLNAINAEAIVNMDEEPLKDAIRPAGYFNQKAKKLRIFAEFFLKTQNPKPRTPTREQLLSLWGIGPETADSILLYAYKVPIFVVDAYTKRIFPEFKNKTYEEIQAKFHKALPKDFKVYQEYHALIVEHAKRT